MPVSNYVGELILMVLIIPFTYLQERQKEKILSKRRKRIKY